MNNQYQFGPFLLDARERQLRREGQDVHLQPKAFDVLLYLLEHAGSLVSKHQVMDAVWKHAIVTENSLTTCIRQVRMALDDHADAPEYIETIPVSGYRFIAEVTSPDDPAGETGPQAAARSGSAAWVALAAALVLALVFYAYIERDNSQETEQQAGAQTGHAVTAAKPGEWENSIAVLPFVNLSDDAHNEYFSDGLSEEIINLLARTPTLKVIGRTSSFTFKNSAEDLREIGRKLGVKTLLEGSVRKSGDRVRITAQLIDASDGANLWSEIYDRTLTDIFEIQDDVASSIIGALQLHVGTVPTRGRPTVSAEAYMLFLRARPLVVVHRGLEAAELLEQAIALDPGFVEAFELQAFAYWSVSDYLIPIAEGFALARKAAGHALTIEPGRPFARALDLLATGGSRVFPEAMSELERAWRENPVDSDPLRVLIYYLETAGYLREAHRYAEQYVIHDPLSPMANYSLGETLYAIGREVEAMAPMTFAYEHGGGFSQWFLPAMHFLEGDDEIAISQFEEFLESQGISDTAWVRELVVGARDPQKGAAYLERRREEILASLPDEVIYLWRPLLELLNLLFGFPDEFYAIAFAQGPNARFQTGADVQIWVGTLLRRTGFTAHPRYLELAVALGLPDIWEQRGPPDFCAKVQVVWVCE